MGRKHCLLEHMCLLGSGQWKQEVGVHREGQSGQIEPVYLFKGLSPMESVQTQPCNMEIICRLYSDE